MLAGEGDAADEAEIGFADVPACDQRGNRIGIRAGNRAMQPSNRDQPVDIAEPENRNKPANQRDRHEQLQYLHRLHAGAAEKYETRREE